MDGQSSLFRYTKFEHLLDLIKECRLPMLSPSMWEDKNDLYAIEKSLAKNEVAGVCCFTRSRKNSIYRWSKMSQSCICVRIEFDVKRIKNLLEKRSNEEHFQLSRVKYKKLKELKKGRGIASRTDIAAIKHFAYSEEKESRIIYRSEDSTEHNINPVVAYLTSIPKDSIKGIRFSPYVPKEVFEFIRPVLYQYLKDYGWKVPQKKITQSKILDYYEWKDSIKKKSEALNK